MILNELTTYKIGSVCLTMFFLLAIIAEKSFTWFIGIVLILITLIVRANLGEITKKSEIFFVVVITMIMCSIVILMLIC